MNKERIEMYAKICQRAEKIGFSSGESRIGALMDIESADIKFNLRLDDWLNADDFNFAHDYCGIKNCIVRSEFPAKDFGLFVPRFAGAEKAPKTVDIEIYGALEKATFMEKDELLKMNVRYLGTDIEFSEYDIYEHNETGEYYATTL